jgi:integrase
VRRQCPALEVRDVCETHAGPSRNTWKHPSAHDAAACDLCGSLLLALGVDIKVIQDTLGHSSTSVTGDVYTHVQLGLKRQAAEAMHRLLGNGTEGADEPISLTQRRAPRRASAD